MVTSGQWGLLAALDGLDQADQYNWDYPNQPSDSWGSQQFLVRDGQFVYVDDPIRLAPVTLQNHAGLSKRYALQFDGSWVGGLPDIYRLLQGSGYQMTPEIAAQVVAIPDGTPVTDGADQYLFKAVELQEFLPVLAAAPSLSLDTAAGIDLATAPAFEASWANVAAQPTVPLKYSEGKLVQ
jgi:hypothetical protein